MNDLPHNVKCSMHVHLSSRVVAIAVSLNHSFGAELPYKLLRFSEYENRETVPDFIPYSSQNRPNVMKIILLELTGGLK